MKPSNGEQGSVRLCKADQNRVQTNSLHNNIVTLALVVRLDLQHSCGAGLLSTTTQFWHQ